MTTSAERADRRTVIKYVEQGKSLGETYERDAVVVISSECIVCACL